MTESLSASRIVLNVAAAAGRTFRLHRRDYAGGLVDRKLEPDRRLSSEAERNWAEITTGQLNFDRKRDEAQALRAIREGDLLRFFDRCTRGGRKQCG